MKKNACLLAFLLLCLTLYAKETFSDKKYGSGHADDISKLLTGKPYYSNSGNHRLFPVLTGLAHIMYLTVDSTSGNDQTGSIDKAVKYLKEHEKELNIKPIPHISDFLTPGSSFHGEYTHLGWEHNYTFGETQQKFDGRKEILRDALGKLFSFGINGSNDFIKPSKRDSFAALLYYVHILGDHIDNTIATARTRIPIKDLHEQDFILEEKSIEVRWENNKNGIPSTTIIAELNKHLAIVFSGQQNDPHYTNMIKGINGYLPEGQQEKANWLLNILFSNVPHLLKNESFAKSFCSEIK